MKDFVAMWRGRRVDEMSKAELVAALSEMALQLHLEREMAHAKLIADVKYRAAVARLAVAG